MARGMAVATALAGCSGAHEHPAPSPCLVELAGDTTEAATSVPNCASLAVSEDAGGAGGYVLGIDARTPRVARLSIRVPLGPEPSPGSFSSDTIAGWSAVTALAGDSNCTYAAGSDAVPKGSLTLTLTSVGTDGRALHGTVDATLYVHAPFATDCGPSDVERVVVAF
jgi:hypothetical protein